MTRKHIIKALKVLGLLIVLLVGSFFAYSFWYNNIKKYHCSFDVLGAYHVSIVATIQDVGIDYICYRKITLSDKNGKSILIELAPSRHLGITVKHDTINLKGRRMPVLLMHNVDHSITYQVLDMDSLIILKANELQKIIGSDPHLYQRDSGITYDDYYEDAWRFW